MPSGSWGEAGRADFPAASKLFQAIHLSGMKGRQRVISIHARLVGRYWLFVHAAGESSDAFPEGDFPEGTEIVVREKGGKLDFTKEKK